MPVSDVTMADMLATLIPIWHGKPETARRVRQRIGAAMTWAVAMGYRPDKPAGDRPRAGARAPARRTEAQ